MKRKTTSSSSSSSSTVKATVQFSIQDDDYTKIKKALQTGERMDENNNKLFQDLLSSGK
jgi:hypothetical protein